MSPSLLATQPLHARQACLWIPLSDLTPFQVASGDGVISNGPFLSLARLGLVRGDNLQQMLHKGSRRERFDDIAVGTLPQRGGDLVIAAVSGEHDEWYSMVAMFQFISK